MTIIMDITMKVMMTTMKVISTTIAEEGSWVTLKEPQHTSTITRMVCWISIFLKKSMR